MVYGSAAVPFAGGSPTANVVEPQGAPYAGPMSPTNINDGPFPETNKNGSPVPESNRHNNSEPLTPAAPAQYHAPPYHSAVKVREGRPTSARESTP